MTTQTISWSETERRPQEEVTRLFLRNKDLFVKMANASGIPLDRAISNLSKWSDDLRSAGDTKAANGLTALAEAISQKA